MCMCVAIRAQAILLTELSAICHSPDIVLSRKCGNTALVMEKVAIMDGFGSRAVGPGGLSSHGELLSLRSPDQNE